MAAGEKEQSMSKASGVCPYCGQSVMGDGDARESCACHKARKYRKILAALDKQSSEAAPMKEIDEAVMDGLKLFAHLI